MALAVLFRVTSDRRPSVPPPAAATEIACAEPDPFATELIRRALAPLGLRARAVAGPRAALDLVLSGPSLLIVGETFGGGRGVALAGEARRVRPGVEVLLLTADPRVQALVRDLAVEGVTVAARPFSVDDLTRAVAGMMDRQGVMPGPALVRASSPPPPSAS
ncbi:MAG: hypothetical protein FJ104_12400, partial [Deltaproteobacteria bacterium]|nr:hypothetical protein [Deltaproteobacteria bacterium]